MLQDYKVSKTLAEKELLSFENKNGGGLEVVTLACGLIGGDTVLPFTPGSSGVLISQLTNNELNYNSKISRRIEWKNSSCSHRRCLRSTYFLHGKSFSQG